ncbi:MAG TPA: dual specificity protein phosphatase [Ktedonobacteraceae bacterium]|nr:dual specificity protein phosphatase [Ktedonobacteraceae bacterium]
MSTDPEVTSPSADTPETIPVERPRANFSGVRWFSTGIVRLSYRGWTRISAFLFPEDSKAEQIAQKFHIPLPDKLNMSWITTHLAVGGRVHPDDIKALAAVGITHVVDTRSEYCDDAEALAKEHIELLHLPTPDTKPLTIEQMLKGSQWVQERMKQGGRVLIHCEHGVGRSALLTCAVLVYDGMHAYDALHLVQEKRWQAAPNHRQVRRLREFESAVVASRNA